MNNSPGNTLPINPRTRMPFYTQHNLSQNQTNNLGVEDEPFLTLSLSPTFETHIHHHAPPKTTQTVPPQLFIPPPPPQPEARAARVRRRPSTSPREGKSETVPPPFPWATNKRATVHSMNHLLENGIFTITGDVNCKRCERVDRVELDLREKFEEIGSFVVKNRDRLCDRAPSSWSNPVLLSCRLCQQENSAKPVIATKKKEINWLFLLLTQTLGLCTLNQLKYFCKHTKNHRTGAKDRVLYLTYLALCKQVNPNGPFDR